MDRGSGPPPQKKKKKRNLKNKGFLSNTGPDPLENYKATKPAVNIGPLLSSQKNAIEMAFCWSADDGPF